MSNKDANSNSYMSGEYMNLELTGIHLDITDDLKDYINKKLHRLKFANSYIIDLHIRFIKEKHGHKLEATINFRWGSSAHVHVDAFDMYEGSDKLFDKIESKIKKEKDKVQQHY